MTVDETGSTAEVVVDTVKNDKKDLTFTQADLDAKISERLAREKVKFDKLNEELNSLKASSADLETTKSELAKVLKERDELKSDNNSKSSELLKFQIAASKGLSFDVLEFLVGDTEEEISEKADRLKEKLGVKQNVESQYSFQPKDYKKDNESTAFFKKALGL